jgi:hypothetical protein
MATMRFHVPVGVFIAVVLLPVTVLGQTSSLTYAKDIAPLLNAKCVTCHRPGEVAPMSLMTYNDVRPWARAIKSKVVSRQMPPWYAEGEPGKWHNDRRLSQAEIEKISAWADAGAPRGNESDMPAPPRFAQGWNHPSGRPPDVIVEAPEMKVTAEGESPWLFAYVKLPFQGDIWVAASQIVPGNRGAVHHVMVTDVRLPPNVTLDAEGRVQIPQGVPSGPPPGPPPPQTGGGGAPDASGAGDEGFTMGFYGGWEPGIDAAVVFPEGVASHITGTHFMFNLHYQATGRATTDKTRIGLWLQKGPVTHELRGSTVSMGSEVFLVEGKELTGRYTAQVTQDVLPPGTATVLNIPAFAENYRLTNILPVRRELTAYAFQPHMHLRGKSMKYTAVYPDGREEVLINVPKYDFNWQIVYELAKPITLPAGSAIRVEAVWDNSAKNKYNPRPDQEVRWGEQSWDEMMSPLVYGSVQLRNPIVPVTPQPQR